VHIADVRAYPLEARLAASFGTSLGAISSIKTVVVEVLTDEGLAGLGEAHGEPLEVVASLLAGPVLDAVRGHDPLDVEARWREVFALTYAPRFGRGGPRAEYRQWMAALSGLDLALWDLKGQAAGQPVFRLLGGSDSDVPVYATGGYYQDGKGHAELVAEVGGYLERFGYRQVKLKTGRGSLDDQVERVRAVRQAFPDLTLMLDGNWAYDVPAAIAASRAFEPLGIRWFEEPVHWYDPVFGLAELARESPIPIASGEGALTFWEARALVDHAGIQVLQPDCTRIGGLTEALRVARYAVGKGVGVAPHHAAHFHGHLLSALPNGISLETFPDPVRDPLWEALWQERPSIEAGRLRLTDRPGWGLAIDREAIRRYHI
jgi:L-alanine-DL-glutamate epimerase-like enolase superfamily enzyme